MTNILTNKQTVTLSIGYAKWYADKHQWAVNYAAISPDKTFQVRRRHADNTYTLMGNGLILLGVPRHLIIAERMTDEG